MPKIIVMIGDLNTGFQMTHHEKSYVWLRIVGANGEIMLDSEDYSSVGNARRAARRLSKLTGWITEEK